MNSENIKIAVELGYFTKEQGRELLKKIHQEECRLIRRMLDHFFNKRISCFLGSKHGRN